MVSVGCVFLRWKGDEAGGLEWEVRKRMGARMYWSCLAILLCVRSNSIQLLKPILHCPCYCNPGQLLKVCRSTWKTTALATRLVWQQDARWCKGRVTLWPDQEESYFGQKWLSFALDLAHLVETHLLVGVDRNSGLHCHSATSSSFMTILFSSRVLACGRQALDWTQLDTRR